MKMKKKLISLQKEILRYKVPVPERFQGECSSTIYVEHYKGEYVYKPKKGNFLVDTGLASDELQAVVDELKRLNKSE